MGGRSTLLSLLNGGGKSVLVQMMTAPFVHKQYRKTKDRPLKAILRHPSLLSLWLNGSWTVEQVMC